MATTFNILRKAKGLHLATAFFVAATAFHVPRLEDPRERELQRLARLYDEQGPMMNAASYERFAALLNDPEVRKSLPPSAAFCAHGTGAPAGGSAHAATGTAAGCPCATRRKKGDLSHLLAIDHLSYYM